MVKIILCGKGGAGIKYLSIILAKSAIACNYDAKLLLSYGPEARGGDISAYLTIDKKEISNPVIKHADWLVSFNDSCINIYKFDELIKGNSNNMETLGFLAKKLGLDIDIVISMMEGETGEKYKYKVPHNKESVIKGYTN